MQLKDIERDHLSFSPAEMLCLTLWLSLVVDDAVLPNNPAWEYYLTLREIVDILLLKHISDADITYLDHLITEHNELYMLVFQKTLKPKHYHLLYYKRSLLETGSRGHNWAMRFESKKYVRKMFASCTKT